MEVVDQLPKDVVPIPDVDRYYINRKGEVFSIKYTQKIRKITPTLFGKPNNRYFGVTFRSERGLVFAKIHRILAELFIPNPDFLPIVRHLNDNPLDNRIENLSWGSPLDNEKDKIRNGYRYDREGEKNGNSKLFPLDVLNIRRMYEKGLTRMKIANLYGISWTMSDDICRKKNWRHI
jgi:hypothetical protein